MSCRVINLLGQPFKHIKSGDIYTKILLPITNATNGPNDGQPMVLYINNNTGRAFVRDREEHRDKFRAVGVIAVVGYIKPTRAVMTDEMIDAIKFGFNYGMRPMSMGCVINPPAESLDFPELEKRVVRTLSCSVSSKPGHIDYFGGFKAPYSMLGPRTCDKCGTALEMPTKWNSICVKCDRPMVPLYSCAQKVPTQFSCYHCERTVLPPKLKCPNCVDRNDLGEDPVDATDM